jgi:glycosyltransferase involved in cell wall biosynthesis
MDNKGTRQNLISICIPAYEKPEALNRLLQSISIQRFRNFEVIITDDSKTDAAEKIVAAYIDKLPLQYCRNRVWGRTGTAV